MSWITFAYSLPKNKSSARVMLWRRLQRLGAVAPAGNLYVLPTLDECIESFQWLTQEIQQAGGQAIMGYCDQFEGMSEQAIIDLFCAARAKEYTVITEEVNGLEGVSAEKNHHSLQVDIVKLRRQYTEIKRIDYFDCPEGNAVATRLTQLEWQLAGGSDPLVDITVHDSADFQQKTWVTRPRPHVDRLSSIWLIRRFIDPTATIRYDRQATESEITFDMPDARFGHTGHLCTLETLIHSFQIKAAGLQKVAEIVHEIDLHDGLFNHPETVGIDAILQGWLKQALSDEALAEQGITLFDGLLAASVDHGQSGTQPSRIDS